MGAALGSNWINVPGEQYFCGGMLAAIKKGQYLNKSCMQNAGAPSAAFDEFGTGAGDKASTMTKLANCPGNSIATCELKLKAALFNMFTLSPC